MSKKTLRYRPHHILCSIGFQGKGYSDAFTANMRAIVDGRLRQANGDAVEIDIVPTTDDICAPCPKRRGTLCENHDKITALDARHAHALDIAPGTRLSWGAAKARVVSHVPPGSLSTICAGCQWLPLGICEAALSDLHARHKADTSQTCPPWTCTKLSRKKPAMKFTAGF